MLQLEQNLITMNDTTIKEYTAFLKLQHISARWAWNYKVFFVL